MVMLYDKKLREQDPAMHGDLVYSVIEFDAVVSVTHQGQSQVTQHPVEEGQDLSDHTTPQPKRITLGEAIVSNFPLALPGTREAEGLAGGVSAGSFAEQATSVGIGLGTVEPLAERAYEQLEKWRLAGTRLVLVDDLQSYENVLIESVIAPREAGTSNALHATIQLVDVLVATTRLVDVPKRVTNDRGAGKANKGPKPSKAADEGQTSSGSALYNLGGKDLASYLGVGG